MTSQNDPNETRSDASQPDTLFTDKFAKQTEEIPCSSFGTTTPSPSGEVVTFYGTTPGSVSLPYDPERERKRLENLRANRAPEGGSSFAQP